MSLPAILATNQISIIRKVGGQDRGLRLRRQSGFRQFGRVIIVTDGKGNLAAASNMLETYRSKSCNVTEGEGGGDIKRLLHLRVNCEQAAISGAQMIRQEYYDWKAEVRKIESGQLGEPSGDIPNKLVDVDGPYEEINTALAYRLEIAMGLQRANWELSRDMSSQDGTLFSQEAIGQSISEGEELRVLINGRLADSIQALEIFAALKAQRLATNAKPEDINPSLPVYRKPGPQSFDLD